MISAPTQVALICLLASSVDGQLFGFLDSYSPTKVIDGFREQIIKSRQLTDAGLAALEAVTAQVQETQKLANEEEKILKELGSSATSLQSGLQTKIKLSSDRLVKNIKKGLAVQGRLDAIRVEGFKVSDDLLQRIYGILKVLGAADEDLPPVMHDLMGEHLKPQAVDSFIKQEELEPFEAPSRSLDEQDYQKAYDLFRIRQQVFKTRQLAGAGLTALEAVTAQLQDTKKLAVDEEKKLEELGSSVTSLLLNLPSLHGKVQLSSDLLVKNLKTGLALQGKLDAIREEGYKVSDDLLQRLHGMLKVLGTADDDLPPLLQDLMGTHLRPPVEDSIVNQEEVELFEAASRSLDDQDYQKAYELFSTLRQSFKEGELHSISEFDVLDKLQTAAFKLGSVEEAADICKLVLARPDVASYQRSRFTSILGKYEQELAMARVKELTEQIDKAPVEKQTELAREFLDLTTQYEYCREEFTAKNAKEQAANPKLFCRYDDRNRHPLLVLAPVKEEFVNIDPIVVKMHDLILVSEAKTLTEAAEAELSRAQAGSGLISRTNDVMYLSRKAEVAWMANDMVPRLTARIEAYTGLDPSDDACEPYQDYIPHFDSLPADRQHPLELARKGNRIATLMLYVNDVEEGGGTLFTDVQLHTTATALAGLFWYNFHKNASVDARTLHGGCPIIQGHKWVVNKWFRWHGQFLHRPHGFRPEEDFSVDDFSMSPAARRKIAQKSLLKAPSVR